MRIAILIAVIAISGGWFAWERGILFDNPRAPTKKNFEKAVLQELHSPRTYQSHACARFNYRVSPPDEEGLEGLTQREAPGQLVVTIVRDPQPEGKRQLQFRQLEALVRAGFFEKSDSRITKSGGDFAEATRFKLTWEGWAKTDQTQGLCFRWGQRTVIAIESFEKVRLTDYSGDAYQVTYRYGVKSPEGWIANRETQALFGVEKELLGEIRSVTLVRTPRGWSDIDRVRTASRAPGDSGKTELTGTPVDKSTIAKLLEERIARDTEYLPKLCLPLPPLYGEDGGIGFLAANREGSYQTVLWESDTDSIDDRTHRAAERATLNMLVRAGVFTYLDADIGRYRGERPVQSGRKYVLKLEYEKHLAKLFPRVSCLLLAEPLVEVIDVNLPVKFEGQPLKVNFRVRLTAKSAYEWARQPVVTSDSPVARVILSDGVGALGQLIEKNGRWELGQWAALMPGIDMNRLRETVVRQSEVLKQVPAEQPSASRVTRPALNVGEIRTVTLVSSGRVSGGRISDDGLSATYCCVGAFSTIRATQGRSRGRHYFEATLMIREGADTPAMNTAVGITRDPNESVGGRCGYRGTDESMLRTVCASFRSLGVYSTGRTVIGVAMDLDQGQFFYRVDGRWINGEPGRSRGWSIASGETYVPFVSVGASSSGGAIRKDVWRANFGASPFVHEIPVGYASFDGRQR